MTINNCSGSSRSEIPVGTEKMFRVQWRDSVNRYCCWSWVSVTNSLQEVRSVPLLSKQIFNTHRSKFPAAGLHSQTHSLECWTDCEHCPAFKNRRACSWRQEYSLLRVNLLKPTGHVMHQQFNIQQLYVLPTLYLCVWYLSENKQRLVSLTA